MTEQNQFSEGFLKKFSEITPTEPHWISGTSERKLRLTPELLEEISEALLNLEPDTWCCGLCLCARKDGGPPIHYDFCPVLRIEQATRRSVPAEGDATGKESTQTVSEGSGSDQGSEAAKGGA